MSTVRSFHQSSPPTESRQGDAAMRGRSKAIAATTIGNVLEWYDFAVYGYLATIIAAKFFAPGDDVSALLSTFAIFGLAFIVRPIGGFFIGRLADTKGRKPALMLTILLMAVGTAMIGLLPTYASIGIFAPLLLVTARLMQGFSAGGEWGTATAFLVEWAPAHRRGSFGSLQQCTVMLGLLLGSGMSALLNTALGSEAMETWGWRVPFLFGAVIGPIGFIMRRNILETPAFSDTDARERSVPQWGPATRLFALVATPFAVAYIFLSYFPTFSQKYGHLTRSEALWANTVALAVLVVTVPLAGALSDLVGRRRMLILGGLAFLLLTYPMLSLTVSTGGFGVVIAVQIGFALFYSIYTGAGAAAYVELFPTSSRLFWLSSSYNLSGIVFGAFAPYIATWLIDRFGSPVSVGYLVIIAATVSLVGMIGMRETAHQRLR